MKQLNLGAEFRTATAIKILLKGKNMEKGKVIFATVIFSLLMAMAITVLIVKDISYKRKKKEYFQETREKLKILEPKNQAIIGKKTYTLNNIEINDKVKNYSFSNGNNTISVVVDNDIITIVNQNKKCGYEVDVKNNKYKKIPNQEDWVTASENEITSLLKNIFKEDLLEKCNVTNF